MTHAPECVTLSNIIVDDIVLWDGRTLMGTLGGSGTHALAGMRVWGGVHGIVGWVGDDFGFELRSQLTQMDADISGLKLRSGATTRAWQILERDDRRHEIFRTDLDAFIRLAPEVSDLPETYFQARAMHMMTNGSVERFVRIVAELHQRAPKMRLVFEPPPEHAGASALDYAHALPLLSLFSPDIDQARALSGCATPIEMARKLIDGGAPLVAIRMGARGSLVHSEAGHTWHIPAVPPRALVDVTGAGNAYCGGFTVSLARGLETHEAALHAAVSASFALEQFGVPRFGEMEAEEIDRRLTWARDNSK